MTVHRHGSMQNETGDKRLQPPQVLSYPRVLIQCRPALLTEGQNIVLLKATGWLAGTKQAMLNHLSHSSLDNTSRVTNNPGTNPCIGVVSLVPIDETLASGEPGMRRPRAAQNDIVLPIKEVCRVRWVKTHRLKTGVGLQCRTCPFPHAAER
jgi:hypothetical protein